MGLGTGGRGQPSLKRLGYFRMGKRGAQGVALHAMLRLPDSNFLCAALNYSFPQLILDGLPENRPTVKSFTGANKQFTAG